MAKVQFTIKNEKGEDVLKTSKEITTMDYRDYLVMNEAMSKDMSDVEKLDRQLDFIAGLFEDVTAEQLLKYTDFARIIEIFADVYAHLVGDVDPKGTNQSLVRLCGGSMVLSSMSQRDLME